MLRSYIMFFLLFFTGLKKKKLKLNCKSEKLKHIRSIRLNLVPGNKTESGNSKRTFQNCLNHFENIHLHNLYDGKHNKV